jgi:O-antigen/teichoic acid export membrane protein
LRKPVSFAADGYTPVDGLSSKLSIYLRSSGASLLATVVSKASGFASVWLLNRILVKGAYGNYEFAFTVVSLLLLLGSGGLNHAVMYRLSRLDAPPEELDGHDFAGAALGWSLIISMLFAGGVFVGAPYIEALASNEDLAFWVSLLAFLMPIGVAREVYKSWFKARQRIPEALIMGKMFPALGKVTFLCTVWVVWQTPKGVVAAVLLSELIPLLIWYARSPVNPLNLWGELSSWDVWYSLKLAVTRGVSKTVKQADILMVGLLATAEATAEYVVAAKIALILVIVHKILNTVLRPRIGQFLAKGSWKKIAKEYDQSRSIALIFSLLGACFLILFGEPILRLFGEYSAAYPALVVLAAGYVITSSFGMAGGYLNIAGYAGWTLTTTVSLLVVNLSLNYVLIPIYGSTGAATATFISYILVNIMTTGIIYYLDRLKVYPLGVAGVTTGVVAIMGALAAGLIGRTLAAAATCVSSLGILYLKKRRLEPILREIGRIAFLAKK